MRMKLVKSRIMTDVIWTSYEAWSPWQKEHTEGTGRLVNCISSTFRLTSAVCTYSMTRRLLTRTRGRSPADCTACRRYSMYIMYLTRWLHWWEIHFSPTLLLVLHCTLHFFSCQCNCLCMCLWKGCLLYLRQEFCTRWGYIGRNPRLLR